jgi:NDP-sugar pyrophosphorylase family protein
MQINHCLILAAGFGTRMGDIGKKLPKVLWPVFEKSLLELQVAYARSLGVENIYINLHHMGEEIEAFCKDRSAFEGVTFLWEKPEILDIGGAIHNLASQPAVKYKGKLLVLNADQFFYLKKDDLFRILTPYEKKSGVLLSYWVNSSLGYNALEIDANRLVKNIIQNKDLPQNKTVETYTGISYIDLAKLKKVPGRSAFFESVCPYKETEIPAVLLENVDYWDFGTVKRYWETTFKLLRVYRERSTHPFIRFLVTEKALKTWKIDLQNLGYHAKSPQVINLNADEEIKELQPTIILKGFEVSKKSDPAIWYNDIVDLIK